MALRIVEFFGKEPLDPRAASNIKARSCPFVNQLCIKPNHGACALVQVTGAPIIACPNRLYADDYKVLRDVAEVVFGPNAKLVDSDAIDDGGSCIRVFGRYRGRELPLPRPTGSKNAGNYFVDWILAKMRPDGSLEQFTAVEVQTIDTTGSYRDQADSFFSGKKFDSGKRRNFQFSSKAGMNWENVNKRILPQLIYKGHVLRGEVKCLKGLFFACPRQVFERVRDRLGNNLRTYHPSNGTITFRSYELSDEVGMNGERPLKFVESFTTTVDQIALAFSSPQNLPDANVYENAILKALTK